MLLMRVAEGFRPYLERDADVSAASSIILDATTTARSGDHDGQVVTIAIDRMFSGGFDPQP